MPFTQASLHGSKLVICYQSIDSYRQWQGKVPRPYGSGSNLGLGMIRFGLGLNFFDEVKMRLTGLFIYFFYINFKMKYNIKYL